MDSHFALCSVKIFIVSQFFGVRAQTYSCVVFGNIYIIRVRFETRCIVEWTNLGVFCMLNVTKGQNGFEIDRSACLREGDFFGTMSPRAF
jgi:hypothetical protein